MVVCIYNFMFYKITVKLCFIRYFFQNTVVHRTFVPPVVLLGIVHHMSRLELHVGHSAESLCTGLARVSFSSSLKLPLIQSLYLVSSASQLSFTFYSLSRCIVRGSKIFVAAMNQKVVLITGCSSGIGLALAVRIARDEKKRFMGKTSK